MSRRVRRLVMVFMATLVLPAAAQQKVWRCGNSYSNQPCDEARAVEVADPRTAAQRRDAERAALRDARLGAELESDREAREAAARQQRAAGLHTARPPEPAASAPKGSKTAKPKTPKNRKRA